MQYERQVIMRSAFAQLLVLKCAQAFTVGGFLPLPKPLPPLKTPHARRMLQQNMLDTVDHRPLCPPATNQRTCGSCWAHSAHAAITCGKRVACANIAVNDMVMCAPYAHGCQGGLPHHAMSYGQKENLTDEQSWQRGKCGLRRQRKCHHVPKFEVGSIIGRHMDRELQSIVSKYGAISSAIALHKNDTVFANYTSGIHVASPIMYKADDLTHAISIVGYSPSYWILRNSWGESWGINGYMFLKRTPPHLPLGLNHYVAFVY